MKLWDDFLKGLELEIGKSVVCLWLNPLNCLGKVQNTIYIKAKDQFQVLWFTEHIQAKAEKFFKAHFGPTIKIKITTSDLKQVTPIKKAAPSKKAPDTFLKDGLKQSVNFFNFLTSKDTLLTYQVLSEVVGLNISTQTLNKNSRIDGDFPYFIYGPKDSGKTHLMQACVKCFLEKKLSVLYIKSQTFTYHFVTAIRTSNFQKFRSQIRSYDALVVEDVENLSGKWATQEEFFHTFNHYHRNSKPILLSSMYLPKDIKELEPRLTSRFEWGMLLPLMPLPKTLLETYALNKLKKDHLNLSRESIHYLIESFPKIKLLEESLEHLKYKCSLAHLENKKIEKDIVVSLLTHLKKSVKEPLTTKDIIDNVAKYFNVIPKEVLGNSQVKHLVYARHLAMYFLRAHLNMSFLKIGKTFNKNHSTVITSIKKIEQSKNSSTLNDINSIKKLVYF